MKNWRVSYLELRNRGGSRSTNSATSSGTIQPTSFGMRSGCFTHVMTRNWERSTDEADTVTTSKMSTEEPSTFCAVEID
jgi:hypothetical protein